MGGGSSGKGLPSSSGCLGYRYINGRLLVFGMLGGLDFCRLRARWSTAIAIIAIIINAPAIVPLAMALVDDLEGGDEVLGPTVGGAVEIGFCG